MPIGDFKFWCCKLYYTESKICTGKIEVLLSLCGDSRASGIRKSHLAVRFLRLFSPIFLKKKLVNFDDFFTSFLKSF